MSRENYVRVILPDSHGNHVDPRALAAFLKDVKALDPDGLIGLGDHLDCAGTFSTHQRSYTNEMAESYQDDVDAANDLFNGFMKAAPRAKDLDYLEGNHEAHVERWASRTFQNQKDAVALLGAYGPEKVLSLKSRGIRYFKRSEHYQGISIPGTIKRGKCFFTHGISHSKHATAVHMEKFGASVVHGHTHRTQMSGGRTVTASGIAAWCPGTLAKLQPLYKHTEPTSWQHGYGVQFVNKSGNFLHINVPILDGVSMLLDVAGRLS